MKKEISVILAFLSAALLCSCGDNAANDENTLTLVTKTAHVEPVYIQRIIELYENKKGHKIDVTAIENTYFEDKASKMFENGDIPDLFIHHNDAELLKYDLSENFYVMNDEPWVDELKEGVKSYCLDHDGNMVGLPFWENSISGCYYNKKILDELGLRPAYTQAEFDLLCQTLKEVGYTPMYWSANGCNWMFQFGLDPIFADNPGLLMKLNKNEIRYADIPEVRDMIEWLYKADQNGWFNKNYETAVWDDIGKAVGNGNSVTLFAWDTWFSTNLSSVGKYAAEDFEVMPIFMNTADSGTYEGGNLAMIMVNKNSPKLELALDFLEFCADPENYNAAFDGVPTVSSFKHQTTNIQADMITNAEISIEENQRVSTAWPKIIGYKQDDVGRAVLKLFKGETDIDGCINLMDEYRIAAAREAGAEGF